MLLGRTSASNAGFSDLKQKSDYSWSFIVLPILLYYIIFNRKYRLLNVGISVAGFCVVVSPWLIGEISRD